MKKSILLSILTMLFLNTIIAQNTAITIIPKPNNITVLDGEFTIDKKTKIVGDAVTKDVVKLIQDYFKNTNNISVKESKKATKNTIHLKLDTLLEKEEYKLSVFKKGIEIIGGTTTGLFYGFQSLKQLLNNGIKVPFVIIDDAPQFKWRAYMIDDSRYFHGETNVKQMLDEMAYLKMNTLHWHLTDDAGWRIEIKKYPLLTEVGSKRKDTEIGTWKSGKTAGESHSGFYTQEQIKDIVAYAAERHITVVPEFEMPGHASSAIAAYTWLGTAGEDIDVPVTFGRHYDNYDVTKPEVIQFFKDVLLELFELFPSQVIHIGGDEVGYKVWEESESVQKYMKEKGLETPADLQIYFTNNISKFIEQNGRRMMGWNEIMGKNIHKGFAEKKNDKEATTSLAKNVVVHFWKGNLDLVTEAAEKGYDIVNSLHSSTYLDYGYKSISLEKAYSFNPIPDGLDQKYHQNIFGLGCQMWSEWTPTNKDVQYQTFPRIAAYAEVGWTANKNKDFKSFENALEKLLQRWNSLGINYSKKY